jgi:phosphotransferase family enzyme
VILEIPTIVSELLPHLFPTGAAHVVCVRTTRTKFLVFAASHIQPECVVQVGPAEELTRLHSILTCLHGRLPDLIPESLVCQPWRGQEFIHVQAGLPGFPWFCLRGRIGGSRAWGRLRERASQVLASLHTAVRDSQKWSHRIRPAEELRQQAALCQDRGIRFTERANHCVFGWGEAFEALGELPCFAQHGDFCLNNLLISESRIAVIDFDEFGRTSMPLQDEIGLAFSFHHFVPTVANLLPPLEDIKAFLPEFSLDEIDLSQWLPGLILHHLLRRINQAHGFPSREPARQSLIAMVEEFASAPEYLAQRSARGGRPDRKITPPLRPRSVLP